jgi:5-hydroxyisourate hydrolase-like protein (transthyretin family)
MGHAMNAVPVAIETIQNGQTAPAREGSKAVRYVLDFSQHATYRLDFSELQNSKRLSSVQCVYVDNSEGLQPILLTAEGTQHTVECEVGMYGYFSLLFSEPARLTVTSAGNAACVSLYALNVNLFGSWQKSRGNDPQPVSGSVSVSNFPTQQTVNGTVEVGNLPATQTVAGSVSVSNLPATQAVSGSVSVSNLPATQTVAGTVNVSNLPPTQAVSGAVSVSNFPATQAVSGSVSVSNQPVDANGNLKIAFPTTQVVSGSVAVSNLPATQAVSGSVSVSNFPATQAVQDNASGAPAAAVPGRALQVAGSDGTLLRAISTDTAGKVNIANFPATQAVSGSVSVSNLPATQAVSGSVSVSNFPATQAVQDNASGAPAVAVPGRALQVAGSDGTLLRAISTDTAGKVNIANFPATQAVSGSVSVSNLPATQAVSGSVSVSNLPATQAVQDNASGAPAVAVPARALYVAGSDGTLLRGLSTDTTGKLNIGNFPATQPVSGSVSVSNFPASQASQNYVFGSNGKVYTQLIGDKNYAWDFVAPGTTGTFFSGTPGYYITSISICFDPTSGCGNNYIWFQDSVFGIVWGLRFYFPNPRNLTPGASGALYYTTPPGFFFHNTSANSSFSYNMFTALTGSFTVFMNYGLTTALL